MWRGAWVSLCTTPPQMHKQAPCTTREIVAPTPTGINPPLNGWLWKALWDFLTSRTIRKRLFSTRSKQGVFLANRPMKAETGHARIVP